MKTFVVSPIEGGLPLVDVLAKRFKLSKKAAKRIVDAKGVSINGKPVWMAKHTLKKNDEVKAHLPATKKTRDIQILLEHKDLIVVSKPNGMLSTGAKGVEGLLREQREEPELELVHRLDRDTSGCLLLARSIQTRESLMNVFRARKIQKEYHAIAYGKLISELTVINAPLEEKSALSKVKIISANKTASHVRIRILTGRTHQIRKHLYAIHHPIIGDREYFLKESRKHRHIDAPRQMLHAARLVFEHPETGERIDARAPLPRDFRACLKECKLS